MKYMIWIPLFFKKFWFIWEPGIFYRKIQLWQAPLGYLTLSGSLCVSGESRLSLLKPLEVSHESRPNVLTY